MHNIRSEHFACVLTIGKFDGVHLGHKAVLKQLIKQAKALDLPSAVMVFEPQPEEYFAPTKAPSRLSNIRDKFEQLAAIGIDRLICIKFNEAFAQLSPEAFVKDLLVKQLGVKFLVVGDDFKFGYQRQGDFLFLRSCAQRYGFDVVSTQSYVLDDCRISSTAVRTALKNSDFKKAHSLLGREFSLYGRVVHGEKNGRKLGFPTANVLVKKYNSPLSGVFAVWIIIDEQCFQGIANLGVRPTLHGTRLQLETHVFNFDGNLYGKAVRVFFKHKIRNEQKFENLQDLQQQISSDTEQAKAFFKQGLVE